MNAEQQAELADTLKSLGWECKPPPKRMPRCGDIVVARLRVQNSGGKWTQISGANEGDYPLEIPTDEFQWNGTEWTLDRSGGF